MRFGSVEIPDREVHETKAALKKKLGGDAGIAKILDRKGATNFDFWVARDGTVWIGGNNSGGQEIETTVNFFTQFPEYKPATANLASNRPENWDPFDISDSSDEESD